MTSEQLQAELDLELAQLAKARQDVDAGRSRLTGQEEVLSTLQARGVDDRQAVRLVELLRDNLAEWERHLTLIEQRIIYLQNSLRRNPQRKDAAGIFVMPH